MLRDLHFRREQGGAKATPKERLHWYGRMLRLTYAASDLEMLEGMGGWAAEALAAEEEEQGERLHALDHLRAINNCLVLMTGRGLEQFMPIDPAEMSQANGYGRRPRRVLSCCLDQGLAGYSMMSFLLYKAQLSIVHINDIYHREWNDVKHSLQQTQLWQSVVLTTLAFNLFYVWPLGVMHLAQQSGREYGGMDVLGDSSRSSLPGPLRAHLQRPRPRSQWRPPACPSDLARDC